MGWGLSSLGPGEGESAHGDRRQRAMSSWEPGKRGQGWMTFPQEAGGLESRRMLEKIPALARGQQGTSSVQTWWMEQLSLPREDVTAASDGMGLGVWFVFPRLIHSPGSPWSQKQRERHASTPGSTLSCWSRAPVSTSPNTRGQNYSLLDCKSSKDCACVWALSHVWLFPIPWTVAHQAPLSMGFSRQEYWSG